MPLVQLSRARSRNIVIVTDSEGREGTGDFWTVRRSVLVAQLCADFGEVDRIIADLGTSLDRYAS